MLERYWFAFFVVIFWLVGVLNASAGDADPLFRDCLGQCKETGCVGQTCFPQCELSSEGLPTDQPWYKQESLYLRWKEWDCQSDCRYHCMVNREKEREALHHDSVKYHSKWPFKRVYRIQELATVVFSVLNLSMHLYGWLSFFSHLSHYLHPKRDKKAYYEFATLWYFYAIFSMNSWIWSAVFHSREA